MAQKTDFYIVWWTAYSGMKREKYFKTHEAAQAFHAQVNQAYVLLDGSPARGVKECYFAESLEGKNGEA